MWSAAMLLGLNCMGASSDSGAANMESILQPLYSCRRERYVKKSLLGKTPSLGDVSIRTATLLCESQHEFRHRSETG
jgi:hypothetical protein